MAVWSSSSIRSLGRFSASKGTPAEASSTTKRRADCPVVAWIEDQGAADREHLLLTPRELIAEIAPPFAEPRKEVVDALRGPRAALGDGREVFLDRERFEDVALLRHPADAGMRTLVRAQR